MTRNSNSLKNENPGSFAAGRRLFRARLLTPVSVPSRPLEDSWRLYEDGGLLVNGRGRIEGAGEYHKIAADSPGVPTVNLSNRTIVPGFIDAHVHLPQYPVAGLYGRDMLDWLRTYIFPAAARFTPAVADRLSPVFFGRLLANGITTVTVYSSSCAASTDKVFEWAHEKHIRAIIGNVMMDRNVPPDVADKSFKLAIDDSEQLCDKWHQRHAGKLLYYAFTPRFAPSCSWELMRAVGRLSGELEKVGVYLQTHLSESLSEVAWVRELFPEARDYTEVYERAGLLGPRPLLAHAIHINERERNVILDAHASLVHCPTSNLCLQSGLMPVSELLQKEQKIALGSDVAGGPTLCPFSVVRAAIYVHNARRFLFADLNGIEVTPATVLYLLTLGGACALGLDALTDSLESGKDADFVVLDVSAFEELPSSSWSDRFGDLLSRFVFLGDGRMVEQTYIQGRCCYERQAEVSDSSAMQRR